MSFKDLLVHVDADKHCVRRLELAVRLARAHGAHLSGVHAIPPPFVPDYYGAGYVSQGFIEEQTARARADADRARKIFTDHMHKAGFDAELREAEGDAAAVLSLHVRYADLAIVGQADPDEDGPVAIDLAADVALASGRPVLIVPYAGRFDTVAENVLIGWNASREATRAVNDALPLLARANKVHVLSVDARGGADLALHLARHGVMVETAEMPSGEIEVGDVLLSRAADLGCDLIVVGAYGHSRLREMVLGGVTRHLLAHMTVPVLMSH